MKGGLKVAEIDQPGFAARVEPLTRQFALRPDWSAEQLAHIIAEAARKPEQGEAVFASVLPRRRADRCLLLPSAPRGSRASCRS